MVENQQTAKQKKSFDKNRLEITSDGKFQLLGQKCLDCGAVQLGRHFACLKCQSRHLKDVNLSQQGKLTNYSVVQISPSSEWKGPVPYVLGEVMLPESFAVTTLVYGLDKIGDSNIGMEMKLDIQKADEDKEGNDVMIYVWKPAAA